MRQLLIAHSSEELASALSTMLDSQFQITLCHDGDTAQALLASVHPQALILDLELPCKDGLSILDNAKPFKPDVIIATVRSISGYVQHSAHLHGIDYVMNIPCPARNIVVRLMEAIELKQLALPAVQEPTSQTARFLQILGIPSQMDGYIQLQTGIPLFVRDRAQKVNKELYPEIAKLCGYQNGKVVERSIRAAVKAAWLTRNDRIWRRFFPADKDGCIPCPSNKIFIARLAEALISRQAETTQDL